MFFEKLAHTIRHAEVRFMVAYVGQQTLQLISIGSSNSKEPKTEDEDNTGSESARPQNS